MALIFLNEICRGRWTRLRLSPGLICLHWRLGRGDEIVRVEVVATLGWEEA